MATDSFRPSVSIVIKTYDDSITPNNDKSISTLKEYLAITLKSLEEQSLLPIEIIVVDSSLGNGIAEVIQNHPAGSKVEIKRIPLEQKNFTYPKALNLGIQHSKGDIIVSLSGDATPANATCLQNLVSPLSNTEVAGTFSRQIIRPGMSLSWIEQFRLWWRYRSRSTTLRYNDHIFSNACSAFRKDLALQIPFDETLYEMEDYAWAKDIQGQGYAIAYVGNSEIFHSHASSSFKTLQRMLYYIYLRMKYDANRNSK